MSLRTRSISRRDFDDALMVRLHAFSNALLAEDFKHFRVHAETNEVVHIFERADTGAVVGFQFWRTSRIDWPRSRTIIGGKVRILPDFRNRGLHLASGLRFYLDCKRRSPTTRYYRLALASLFGFVSISSALAEYHILDPHPGDGEGRAVLGAFRQLAEDNHYRLDEETGLAFVNIRPTPEVLAQFAPSYFEKPAAQIYARVNPGWREDGNYIAFWFRFTPRNLMKLSRTIWRKRRNTRAARA